jgi:uncharacterized protein (UPF0261 family)
MEYIILCSKSVVDLEAAVERQLSRGWKLAGGVAMGGGYGTTFVQAMYKE